MKHRVMKLKLEVPKYRNDQANSYWLLAKFKISVDLFSQFNKHISHNVSINAFS